jgi:hypothetical protein
MLFNKFYRNISCIYNLAKQNYFNFANYMLLSKVEK